jgi:predicted DNA-binding transcriptional regulator AlpA
MSDDPTLPAVTTGAAGSRLKRFRRPLLDAPASPAPADPAPPAVIIEPPPATSGRRFIKVRPAFRKLGVSDATGWRMIADGRMGQKPIALGGRLRVLDLDKLEALMAQLAAAAAEQEPAE